MIRETLEGPSMARPGDLVAAIETLVGNLAPNARQALAPKLECIILAADDEVSSARAVEWTRTLADVDQGRVWVLHALLPVYVYEHFNDLYPGTPPEPQRAWNAEQRGRQLLDAVGDALRAGGIEAEEVISRNHVVGAVAELAQFSGADIVVLGGPGNHRMDRIFVGSVSRGVKGTVPTAIMVARSKAQAEAILLPVDGSRASVRAALLGLRLAKQWRVPVRVLHVASTDLSEGQRKALDAFEDMHWGTSVWFSRMRPPVPEAIVQAAEGFGATLIVLGARWPVAPGVPGLGQVEDYILDQSSSNLLFVRP